MINKNHGMTLYEIWNSKQPDISYFHIFGCNCFIHNNGKTYITSFHAKSDIGVFVGYYYEAYSIYNHRNLTVEESVHVIFHESFICHDNNNNNIHNLRNRLRATNLILAMIMI